MKIFITGITGFVGKHLTLHLAAAGHRIQGIAWQPESEPGSCTQLGDAKVHNVDLATEPSVESLVIEYQPDVIYHLAAQSSPRLAIEDPVGTFQANVTGTLRLLEAQRKTVPSARLIFISSSEVYGQAGDAPLRETDPLRPCNPYGASKASAELLVAQYGRAWNLPYVIMRSFTHTGPGQMPLFVIPAFARQVARIEAGLQEPVMRVGNLAAQRDYLDVEDVVAAYSLLLKGEQTAATYNLCRGEAHSIIEALNLMLARSTREIKVETDPALMRPVDTPLLVGSAEKFRRATGWSPHVSFTAMVERVLAYWRKHVSEEEAA
ncbi:MAG: GDP-mannose 4,6-dehydratase [bacterium]|nr:GDP-mannose 4,6-dehydratase [bacterium]